MFVKCVFHSFLLLRTFQISTPYVNGEGENIVLLYIIMCCQILLLIIMWYGKGHKLIIFKPLVNTLVHAISKWFYTS